tara:strand:- start:25 stop:1047 length:1023 start_codon:yes stop_codon:yes gene_type:complete
MARSYGSFFRQQDLDKPYRGAELALGFLGDILASKNQAALGYDKLAQDAEEAKALKEYQDKSLGANKPWTDPRTGQSFAYDPESGGYTTPIGGAGGGQPHWGRILGLSLKKEHLQGAYGEDNDGDGQPDEFYPGPQGADYYKYKEAKDKKTPGWEDLHPKVVFENMETWEPDESKDDTENLLDSYKVSDYFEASKKHQEVNAAIEQLYSMPANTKRTDVESLYSMFDEQFTDKLKRADVISIGGLMTEKNRLAAMLRGQKSFESFDAADAPVFGKAAGEASSVGELTASSKRISQYDLSDAEKGAYAKQIEVIEAQLSRYKKYGLTFPKFVYVDPLGIED